MIIGKGLLACAFGPYLEQRSDIVVFASGVSNSLETRLEEFAREEALLRERLDTEARRFIYFSSCGITDAAPNLTPYMQHKRAMEALVLSASRGLVLRLPQVVGKTNNPHTLTNFLRDHILSGQHFKVWSSAERNLIDVDDVATIGVQLAIDLSPEPAIVSIASTHSKLMPEIVEIFERVLGKAANCSYVLKGTPMIIDTAQAESIGKKLGIDLGVGYIERVIQKYYGSRIEDDPDTSLSPADRA
ncbi:NAD-dependent epimerase/dehydratase family protein [Rhodanobacter sp. L36]|uniref:NAD-dependent epimerase/dehydratase family protein n=1 Tax=Rhodanobacter sp. L36 TaxID=1747221 RepID=UPI00131E7C3C|nr:NAD-dependent epimerase/dehydratase family protein [Rhodanobacter sp. L36]